MRAGDRVRVREGERPPHLHRWWRQWWLTGSGTVVTYTSTSALVQYVAPDWPVPLRGWVPLDHLTAINPISG